MYVFLVIEKHVTKQDNQDELPGGVPEKTKIGHNINEYQVYAASLLFDEGGHIPVGQKCLLPITKACIREPSKLEEYGPGLYWAIPLTISVFVDHKKIRRIFSDKCMAIFIQPEKRQNTLWEITR